MTPRESKTKYVSRRDTAERYNVVVRSIARWTDDPDLGFPKPVEINGRWFFALDELEAWERQRAATSRKAA